MVSLLSTENIWSRVSRTEPETFKRFEKRQFEFIDPHGDHLTYLKIYRRWVKNHYSDKWCKENFLNIRALKLAENIKTQLQDLIKQLDLPTCAKFYEKDSLYLRFKVHESILESNKLPERELKQKKEYTNDVLDLFDRFRLALTSGFYFNSARKVANSNQDYLLINEGNIVSIDLQSIYTMKEDFPECVIFTELSGTSIVRGMMRLVTKIDIQWITPYIAKMKGVDVFKLAGTEGVKLKNKERGNEERKKEDEEEKKEEEEKRNKVEEAKNRYLERKKLKK